MLKTYFHKNIIWYDFLQPTEEKFLPLSEKLNIDPYLVKKFLGNTNRNKALVLGEHLFLSITIPEWKEDTKNNEVGFKKQEIKFIIGAEYIITSVESKNEGLEFFKEKFEKHANFEKGDEFNNPIIYSFLHIFEKIYESMLFELKDIELKINTIEEHIFSENEIEMVKNISHMNRHLIDFKKNIRGHAETWEVFLPLAKDFFSKKQSNDTLDSINLSYQKVISEMQFLKEYLFELRDTNNSILSGKQKDISVTFTLIVFLTLPITLFVTIISVPQVHDTFLGGENDFLIITGISLALLVLSLTFSRWKKWW